MTKVVLRLSAELHMLFEIGVIGGMGMTEFRYLRSPQ